MMLILGIQAMGHVQWKVLLFFFVIEDLLKVVAPYLVLTYCIEAMKITLLWQYRYIYHICTIYMGTTVGI